MPNERWIESMEQLIKQKGIDCNQLPAQGRRMGGPPPISGQR